MGNMSDLNALDLEPGQIVGGYTLVSRLGGGAMGSVWRVHDDGGQFYAMKILRDSLHEDENASNGIGAGFENRSDAGDDIDAFEGSGGDGGAYDGNATNGQATPPSHRDRDPHVTARERMRREALAMRRVNHPGVCAIVDMELDDSLAFIVTELIEGRNLRDDVATNGRYTGDDLERLSRKLIEAVQAVHEQGIIHRDIKPTNVMVSASGPVLVDFGIAMTEGESHVTRTGLVMGTPGFIAPEIIDGAESDEATDWWSLASVLAFAATGRPVFGSKPMMAVLEREASGNANLAGLPSRTLAAFRSALDPNPSKRCTPYELLEAITLDALNPMAQGGDSYYGDDFGDDPVGGTEDDATIGTNIGASGTEVVRPFDSGAIRPVAGSRAGRGACGASGVLSGLGDADISGAHGGHGGKTGQGTPDNPRTLWTAGDDGTQVLAPLPAHATTPTNGGSTATVTGRARGNDSTSVLSSSDDQPTVAEPLRSTDRRAPSDVDPADDSSTRILPVAPDAGVGTVALTQAMPSDSFGSTQYAESPTAVYPGAPDRHYLAPTAQPQLQAARSDPMPTTPRDLNTDPTELKRTTLIRRGALPSWLITIPLALLAAAAPIIAMIVFAVITWLLLTLGNSENAQLQREGKRGGQRLRRDAVFRVTGLPWHLVSGLVQTLPRTIVMGLIVGVIPLLISVISGLPTRPAPIVVGQWTVHVPLNTDFSFSLAGLFFALAMVAAWLLNALGARSTVLRLGMGWLRGAKRAGKGKPVSEGGFVCKDEDNGIGNENDTNEGRTADRQQRNFRIPRNWVFLALWLLSTCLMAFYILQGHYIDWTPLPEPQL